MKDDAGSGERLDTWKVIAAYLGHHERTVKRWEAERGLPVHRLPGEHRSGVFAYRSELERWLATPEALVEEDAYLDFESESDAQLPVAHQDVQPLPVTTAPAFSPASFPAKRISSRWKGAAYTAAVLLGGALIFAAGYRYLRPRIERPVRGIVATEQLTSNGQEKLGLLTDGKALYFGQEQEGLFALASMPVAGGAIRTLWSPKANVRPVDLSPDGRNLLVLVSLGVEKECELWVVPLDQGEPRRLSDIRAQAAAWAPDGAAIAFSRGSAVYLVSMNSVTPTQIGSFTGLPYALTWSHDGKALRFLLMSVATENCGKWGELSGPGLRTATERPMPSQLDGYLVWARAAGIDNYYAVGADRSPGKSPLWRVHYGEGWSEPPVTTAPIASIPGAATGLAFAGQQHQVFVLSETATRPTFLRFDPGTGGFRQILPGVSGVFLDYSRDGQWVAYVTFRDGLLWVSRANGQDVRQVSDANESVELPRWSPDGKRLAYMARRDGQPWRIYVRNLTDGNEREASEGTDSQGAPTWSQDGRFLAYGNVDCEEVDSCAVHRIDLATGKAEALPQSNGLATARWSPDGRSIAALNTERHELMLFDVKLGRWHKLADAIDSTDLSWSADSKYLYSNMPGADARIIRIRVADGREETVFDLRSQDKFNVAESDDLLFSLAPDDAPILHRRIHSQEIYAYDLQDR